MVDCTLLHTRDTNRRINGFENHRMFTFGDFGAFAFLRWCRIATASEGSIGLLLYMASLIGTTEFRLENDRTSLSSSIDHS